MTFEFFRLHSYVLRSYKTNTLLFPVSIFSIFLVFCICGTVFHCLMSDSDTHEGKAVRASQAVPKTEGKESSDDEILEVTETSPTKESTPDPPAERAPTSATQSVPSKAKKKGMHFSPIL